MTKKTIEYLKPEEIVYADLPEETNRVIVETAGFVPLEVKLKRFEQNGYMMKFNESEFTSSDYRDMYLNPDFEIYPEDDVEEALEKIEMQRQFIAKRKIEKTPEISGGNSGVAPQADNQNTSKKTEEVNENSSQTEE